MGASTSVMAQSVAFRTLLPQATFSLIFHFLTRIPTSYNYTYEAILKHEEVERYVQQTDEQKEAAGAGESEKLPQLTPEEHRLRREEGLCRLEEKGKAGLAKRREDAVRKLEEQEALTRKQEEEFARQGVRPEVWPTSEEIKHAEKQLIQPSDEYFHCAIAGCAGSGKSSLINAFRGLRNNSPGAAPTGLTETTLVITAYPDPSPTLPQSRFVWYDIPGAGTITIPGSQYFNNQGLFVFDLIIVVVDNRIKEQDLAILQHCERYNIPSFLVRSKANQHIGNTMKEDGWLGSHDERDFNEFYQPAREMLVSKTRASFRKNLEAGGLDPEKEVFIVSRDGLAGLVSGEKKKLRKKNQLIHEEKLVLHCLEALKARRYLMGVLGLSDSWIYT